MENVNINNGGTGYTSVPTVTIAGAGGSGVVATASMGVASITIPINGHGGNYLTPPTYTFSGGGFTLAATPGTVSMGLPADSLPSTAYPAENNAAYVYVKFGAGDPNSSLLAPSLAIDLANGINGAGVVGLGATASGDQVSLQTSGTGQSNVVGGDGPLTVLDGLTEPFTITGVGHGGTITGMAEIGGTMYAVSSRGDLFTVNLLGNGLYNGVNVASSLVGTIVDANGNNVPFTGLTAGPPDLENGAYADTLFATDANGNIWALNPNTGTTSPIFPNDSSFITVTSVSATGTVTVVKDITGLAFSTLDYNLWHETDLRSGNAGEAIDPSPDNVYPRTITPNVSDSYYFGLDEPSSLTDPYYPALNDDGTSNIQPGLKAYATNPTLYNTFNLPGGAGVADDQQRRPVQLLDRR